MSGGLISVNSEVVRQTLVGRMVELVGSEPEPRSEPLAGVPGAETALASAGYRLREVERRLFEPARSPLAELGERVAALTEQGCLASEAIARVCGELAAGEPLERPEPGDERAVSWRVPGPGGHVRHYVALELIGDGPPELKRAVLYGYLVRCCEEAVSRD